ncbi:MAG: RidA family protein [Flammeovirgaceae bacterium]
MKKVIYSEKAPEPIGPYSQAIMVGNTLYISGQIPINRLNGGTIVSGSIEAETEQVMKNLSYILEAAGMSFQNVVKSSIFIKNMNDFARINQVYGQYFKENAPARETVEVARLPKDVNVEISCIAVKD